MGKRELFLILGFIVAGVIVFQFTAPPAREEQGFSFSRFLNNARRGIRGNPGHASWTTTESVPVPASVREIRIRTINGAIRVAGEARTDIAVEFTVESNGPDDAGALELAKQSLLKHDSLEEAIVFAAQYPAPGRQFAAISLRVPKRLAVRLDGGNRLTISDLASVRLNNGAGDSTIERIAGEVTGDFARSNLDLKDVGSVDMSLSNANSRIVARGPIRLDLRDGRCEPQSDGSIDLDSRRTSIHIRENKGPVRISGNEGSLEVIMPGNEVRADMRRAEITAEVRRAVPMTLSTTDESIEFALSGSLDGPADVPRIELDAVASEGEVRVIDWPFSPTNADRESRLHQLFGPGPRVSLRTVRSDIVIKKAK